MRINKYIGFFMLEWWRFGVYLSDFVLRIVLICLRLALPYSVFLILVETGKIDKSLADAMIWAVLIGQILSGSGLRLEKLVKEDIRSGNIGIRLSEPVNYVTAKLFQSLGKFVPMAGILSIIFFLPMSIFFPTKINFLVLIIFVIISFLISSLVGIAVGLTSFIIEENDGIFYITSKLFMIFGNQIIPIALMPAWAISLAQLTPFYYGLAAPIEAASGRLSLIPGLATGVSYVLLLFFLCQFMLKKLQKKLILNG